MKRTHMQMTMAAVVGIISLSLAGSAAAHGKDHSEKRVEWIKKEVGLNDQQAAQVKSILETQHAEMQQAWSSSHEKAQSQINALLTPAQQAKYAELAKKRHDMKRSGGCHDDDDDDEDDGKDVKKDTASGTSEAAH